MHTDAIGSIDTLGLSSVNKQASLTVCWSAPLKRIRVLGEGSHMEILDDQRAKTTKP